MKAHFSNINDDQETQDSGEEETPNDLQAKKIAKLSLQNQHGPPRQESMQRWTFTLTSAGMKFLNLILNQSKHDLISNLKNGMP